ncbi:hypothetical protein KZO85_12145 [Chromohalobacter canadensis]|uniref:hypothetical protein n=1 Tax=Chromohalobacter canadensis TaxID=141389 RepID=UPI0021C1811D|nr:hypothetical protein [Chromohalobacter canadensis]MCT8469335.1 hypothetical protein [Chromohalobacter canadensis]MCT8471959.1 hypothetical protein [Chromohalobacter canadensis]MCT8499928.1 hypothetical protein [Chromohalobacter canadensis]
MPTTTTSRLPPPTSWDEFEDVCKSSFSLRWANPNLARHGRQGQAQDGVDIYGVDSLQNFVGIQCKNTISTISQQLIESECLKAEKFTPELAVLYIATTADRDVNIQAFTRRLSEERRVQNKFPVDVVFWPDIVHDLSRDDAVVRQHFPQFFNTPTQAPRQLMREKDVGNIISLIEVIDFSSTYAHLRWGAKYIHCSILEQMDNINSITHSPVFNLHDQTLLAAVNKLIDEWSGLCSLVRQAPYDLIPHQDTLSFCTPGDCCRNQEENDLFEKINEQIRKLLHSINSFCQLINTSYLEINLERSSLKARALYS